MFLLTDLKITSFLYQHDIVDLVNLQFMTVTASFCTAVAVARSCLFCIYVFDFALSTVAFCTCPS